MPNRKPMAVINDPSKAGQLAGKQCLFGPHHRYAVAPIHTRFDRIAWFVWDAERPGPDGEPAIIRQADTREGAIRELEDC